MSKPKILIVEDDPFSVQLLRHNLKGHDVEILPVAATVEDALKVSLEYEPDVALVDIYLTGERDGLEAARLIQDNFDIPIIYLTGYSSEEVFESAKATDPFGYLLKPYTAKELRVTLDMALYKHAMNKELRGNKARLETTLGVLNEAVITTDPEWKVVYANPAAHKWLEISEGDGVDTKLNLSVPHTDTPVPFDPGLFANASGPVCRLRTLNGESFVRMGILPLPKSTPGYVVVVWNVTEEYKNQKDAEAVFDAMESLDEGLLILHPQTEKILFVSKGFERMTGWESGEVIGEVPFFLFGPQNKIDFWQKAREVLRKAGYVKAENPLFTKEGKEILAHWQISRMAPTHGHDDGQLMVFVRDITLQRRMEEELRQSQKIEAVGRLAGGVAHDFNNLLSVINSYADLLTLKLPGADPLLKYVGNIRMAGQRAAELVAKLLTFSRRDSAKPMLLDVQSLTEDVHKMLRRVIRQNIEIKLEFSDKLMALWADQLQIEQIIMNLCVNARDAIENAGCIKIAWGMEVLSEVEAAQKKIAGGNYLVLKISDTGGGMEPEVLDRVFEPYFTTKGQGKGTGLGLSIVYAIVRQLNGTIEIDSKVGKGTCFRIYFPASDKPAKMTTQAPVIQEPQHGDEHILIVEDEESFAECLQSLLGLHGYKVHHAKNAAEALEVFEQSIYPIQLLISDVMLPQVSGQELALKLKEKNPELKMIFITGYDNALQMLQNFPHTALVLQKPFSVVSILNKIREVLDTPQDDKKIQIL